jgi:hypothetical protein
MLLTGCAGAIGAAPTMAAPIVVPGLPPVCVFGCAPSNPGSPSGPAPTPAPTSPAAPALPPPDNAIPRCSVRGRVARAAPAGPSTQRRAFGEHASLRYFSGRSLCRRADLTRAAGVRYVREDANWGEIEAHRGRFDWRRMDEVFGVAAQYGLTVLPVPDAPPRWAGPSERNLPDDIVAYAGLTARVAARYGPGGTFWARHPRLPYRPARYIELYNEPYYPEFSGGHPDPARYARLVAAAVPAGRLANPSVRFLIAGESTYTPDGGHTFGNWMEGMYAAVPGFGRLFDGIAVHPYSDPAPPTFYDPTSGALQARRLERVRAALVAHGDAAKHLWVTEVGWSTCPSSCVNERQQAADLRSFFHLTRTRWRSYVDAVFVYALQDYRTKPVREGHFGVLRLNGSQKPAWSALRSAARRG